MVSAGYAHQSIGILELRRNIDTAEKGSGNPGSFFYIENIMILSYCCTSCTDSL